MARRRQTASAGARDRLIEETHRLHGYAVAVGDEAAAQRFQRRLDDLAAGRPVIVAHGWEIDLPPSAGGPFLLDADGGASSAPSRTGGNKND